MSVRITRRYPATLAPAVLLAWVLAACASTPAPSPEAIHDPAAGTPGLIRIEGTTGTTEIRTVNDPAAGTATPIRADADKAFGALRGVYDGLGLAVNTLLSDTRTLGVRNARAPRRVGGQPLSRLIECGSDATGMANADAYAVTLTAVSRVTVVGPASSLVVTQVLASAKPMSTSGNEVRCSSSGRLEQTINDAVAERVKP